MKSTGFFLGILLLLFSCKTSRESRKTSQGKPADTVSWPVSMNYSGLQDSMVVHPDTPFVFTPLSPETFAIYKKNYFSKIDTNAVKVRRTDTSFTVLTKDSVFTYKADEKDYSRFATYCGFLVPTGLFLVADIDGDNEVGSMVLIDKANNKRYELSSPFDDPCTIPFISPGNHYLASFSNDSYHENSSFITLVRINKHGKQFTYTGLINYIGSEWWIEDLVWINEHSFALQVSTTAIDPETNESGAVAESFLQVTFKL